MTYFSFLLYFLVPPIALLIGYILVTGRGGLVRRGLRPIGLVALIALVYTAPWDNYLIYREVWWYGADRVMGTIGLVPIEEYAFMVLQTVMTGLFTVVLFRDKRLPEVGRESRRGWKGAALWLLVAIAGWLMIAGDGVTLYLGLILGWSAPVLAGLWWLGAPRYLAHPAHLLAAVAVPTVYLWNADALAIHSGIWEISAAYTVGLYVGPLPLEEAVFFLVTNMLITKGLTLLADMKIA